MKLKYGIVSDGISARLEAGVDNLDKAKAWAQRFLYPDYQEAQRKRWETKGRSEGYPWPELNERYAEWKKVRYAGYPYAGKRMGVATGELFRSVVGDDTSKFHRKLITNSRAIFGTSLEYSQYFAEARPIFLFSDKTTRRWVKSLKDYFIGPKVKPKKKKRKKPK